MCEAPPQRKNKTVERAGFRRGSGDWAAETERPKGSPKQAAVEAKSRDRRLKREPKS
jgi:hypothetical protein